MNTVATIFFIIITGTVSLLIALKIDKMRSSNESMRQRWARWCFHFFMSAEIIAILVGVLMFLLALIFYKMPMNWEHMQGFCKRSAPLLNPATFSLLIAFLGIFPGILSCILNPKIWRICTLLLIVFLGYEFQFRFMHWLVD